MKRRGIVLAFLGLAATTGLIWVLARPGKAGAHCDTLDGPVVQDARVALEKEDIAPALKWVKPEGEEEVREAFRKTLAVRKLGPEGKALADRYFLETLVRVHRAGEGAPFTGLKPAGTKVEPAVLEADRALRDGSADRLVLRIRESVEHGLRERFAKAFERKKQAGESVAAGRAYVEAYVDFVHYAEGLEAAAARPGAHEGQEAGEAAHRH